jgi:hypothetical protein
MIVRVAASTAFVIDDGTVSSGKAKVRRRTFMQALRRVNALHVSRVHGPQASVGGGSASGIDPKAKRPRTGKA